MPSVETLRLAARFAYSRFAVVATRGKKPMSIWRRSSSLRDNRNSRESKRLRRCTYLALWIRPVLENPIRESQTAIYRNVGGSSVLLQSAGENGSRRNRRECRYVIHKSSPPRCNSFTDKFRRAKHRSQCSILLIGVFAGGIRFNSRMR